MAFSANPQKICLHDRRSRILDGQNVMNAMTIGANGRQCSRNRLLFAIKRGGHAVKVAQIRSHDTGRKPVFFHELFVAMAAGAELWGLEMERSRSRILDIVRSMAIRT